MKKRKHQRIDPDVKYKAVMEFIKNPDTFKNVTKRNNMSTSTLWNYCAEVDAAIKKVVGIDETTRPKQARMLFENPGARRHPEQYEGDDVCKLETEPDDNEIVIRIKVSAC